MKKIQIILLFIFGMPFYVNAITIHSSDGFTVTSFALDAIGVSIEDIQNELMDSDEDLTDNNESRNAPNSKKDSLN